jgi:hypothetical protein
MALRDFQPPCGRAGIALGDAETKKERRDAEAVFRGVRIRSPDPRASMPCMDKNDVARGIPSGLFTERGRARY